MDPDSVLFLNKNLQKFAPIVILMRLDGNVIGINIQTNISVVMHFNKLLDKLVKDGLYDHRRQEITFLYCLAKVALKGH